MERDELAAWLRLTAFEGIGNGAARKLLSAFGLPQAIFQQTQAALEAVVGPMRAATLQAEPAGWAALCERTWAWLESDPVQRRIVTLGDANYPAPLLHIEDPPLLLYLLGRPADWQAPAVAVVGSRNPTPQGLQNARAFSRAFAEVGEIGRAHV